MTSLWPSGAVVKVLACHAGGREFESPLEQFFFFFFLIFFFILFSPSNLFFALVYFSFSYLHNLDFFIIIIIFSNRSTCNFLFKPILVYKLNNLLISQLLILSMNYC